MKKSCWWQAGMISRFVNNVIKVLGKSFTTPINSCVKTASWREWNFSVVWTNFFPLILWLLLVNRCWGVRNWDGFVWVCWNKICYRILSISGRNIQVTFLAFVWRCKTDFCIGIITRKLWFIVKTRAPYSNKLLRNLTMSILLLYYQMTERLSVLTCQTKILLLILYSEVCIFLFLLWYWLSSTYQKGRLVSLLVVQTTKRY